MQHVVAIYLSRLESGESSKSSNGVPDVFPDEDFFKVTTEVMVDEMVSYEDNWLTDMHQFLSTGLPPEELGRDERKRLAVQSQHFCLV